MGAQYALKQRKGDPNEEVPVPVAGSHDDDELLHGLR